MPRLVIPMTAHPLNNDPTAWLCTVDGRYTGREIFRHSPNAMGPVFVAYLGSGQCLEGTFATESDARDAQDAYFAANGGRP